MKKILFIAPILLTTLNAASDLQRSPLLISESEMKTEHSNEIKALIESNSSMIDVESSSDTDTE